MNVFGIGALELLVRPLVAFVALGLGKPVDAAKTTGRMTSEAPRTFNDIMEAAPLSDDANPRSRQLSSPSDTMPPNQLPSDPLWMLSHLLDSIDLESSQSGGFEPTPPSTQR